MTLVTVPVGSLRLDAFDGVLAPDATAAVQRAQWAARHTLAGRRIWNVNSTARGGGVAELLVTLLAYARGSGVDARWAVIAGNPSFFAITKRLHNRLHGVDGDGGSLGPYERDLYEAALAPNADDLCQLLAPDDVVILHDPQTAGLIPRVRALGVPVVWRCHVGMDIPNAQAREAWRFLEPYVRHADRYVFSREAFVWDELDPARRAIIAPTIDVFSPKNQAIAPLETAAILAAAGLTAGDPRRAVFHRLDGTAGAVGRQALLFEDRRITAADRCVVQVSRWDSLKDPIGVIEGFARHVAPATDAHLVYAGPDVMAVADDPEGVAVFAAARAYRESLPAAARERVHLALLPMDDAEENAAIVNALQRRADVVVQKSLAEGFGLTVAEAMWKARPVVASRIGGIQDQIEHGRSGLLLNDPRDLGAFAAAVRELLDDPARAAAIGYAAHERVRERFLGPHSLLDYFGLLEQLVIRAPA